MSSRVTATGELLVRITVTGEEVRALLYLIRRYAEMPATAVNPETVRALDSLVAKLVRSVT